MWASLSAVPATGNGKVCCLCHAVAMSLHPLHLVAVTTDLTITLQGANQGFLLCCGSTNYYCHQKLITHFCCHTIPCSSCYVLEAAPLPTLWQPGQGLDLGHPLSRVELEVFMIIFWQPGHRVVIWCVGRGRLY